MLQGQMTEAEAMALGKKQRAANDLRRSGGHTGGYKGIETPGQAVQVLLNGKKAYMSGSQITDAEGPGDVTRKKPIVQMRQGMSPSSQGYNRSNETPVADASKQLRGYGYDLIRRGKSFEEAKKLMSGTEQYRGLSQSAKDYVMGEFDSWWNNQTAGGKPKREVEAIRRAGQPSMSQAPNRKPDTATANLAKVANSIDNVGY